MFVILKTALCSTSVDKGKRGESNDETDLDVALAALDLMLSVNASNNIYVAEKL